tara:strand:+ start:165 stop:626 length:462 start_codon:yes stop_codon:yes gene_type:complete
MNLNTSNQNEREILISEFQKMKKIIESLPKNSEKTIPVIVNLYYQVTMVQTLTKKIKSDLKSPISDNQNLFDEINKTEKYLREKFSKSLHPEILSQLTNSIQDSKDNLKRLAQNSEQKTKGTIEKEALLYKELRELMSTKQFVEQYEIGIKDD